MYRRQRRDPTNRRALARREVNLDEIQLRNLVPKPTPRNVTFFGMWMIGLFFMLLAPSPVNVSDEALEAYSDKIVQASQVGYDDALYDYRISEQEVYAAKQWPWAWNKKNTAVYERKLALSREAKKRLDEKMNEEYQIIKDAKQDVGLWSEFGMQEIRENLYDNLSWGVGVAKRQTMYQMFWSVFGMMGGMRRDENALGVILQWIGRIMFNLSFGLIMALFSFIFALPSIVSSYGSSFMSGFSFFLLALLGACSVVFTILSCMWGTVVGGTFVVLREAQKQARLQDRARRERLHYQ